MENGEYGKGQGESDMSEENKWYYYNHALLPLTAPHEESDIKSLPFELKKHKKALLARWTTEFDCGYETEWWYCIKDTPFNIADVKAKRRYTINQGVKYFEVKEIKAGDYVDELYEVQTAAFSAYPEKYRPYETKENFERKLDSWEEEKQWINKDRRIFGAFCRETGMLCGYAIVVVRKDYAAISVEKSNPEYEKYQVNASLVYSILNAFKEELTQEGYYLMDSARAISHETHFQDYLEKYFGFRKAYCKLNIKYKPLMKAAVMMLYPFRRLIKKFDINNFIHSVISILYMEEIHRNF